MFSLVFKVAIAALKHLKVVHQAVREILEAVHVKSWQRTSRNHCDLVERVCAFFPYYLLSTHGEGEMDGEGS